MRIIIVVFLISVVLFGFACKNKPTVDIKDKDINLLLLEEVKNGNLTNVKYLVEKGADVKYTLESANDLILTPVNPEYEEEIYSYFVADEGIYEAAVDPEESMQKFELLHTLNKDFIIDSRGGNANDSKYIWLAIKKYNFNVTTDFVERGVMADVFQFLYPHFTPLYLAAADNNAAIAKYLYGLIAQQKAEAEKEIKASYGDFTVTFTYKEEDDGTDFSPLVFVVLHRNMPLLKYLVENGADINFGVYKPLAFAVTDGNLEAVKYLVEHGADVNAKHGHNDTTALEFAQKHNYPEIINYLKENGAR
ncbi:ankyrin repeat protein [Elusimicrobium simillimum]|uniref:ankyrin repeat domain-containing protein n=1 Tax=Elusimicrobium simillimum TaxID=3143438 RepID=UPI003C6F080F